MSELDELRAENARLREVIDSVREMHKPNFMSPYGQHYGCAECINRLDDNCRTFKALTSPVLPVQTDDERNQTECPHPREHCYAAAGGWEHHHAIRDGKEWVVPGPASVIPPVAVEQPPEDERRRARSDGMGAVLMAWRAACPGCAQGDHAKHVRDWNITPGLIGGAWCDCPGEPECTQRFAAFAKRLTQELGLPVEQPDTCEHGKTGPHEYVAKRVYFEDGDGFTPLARRCCSGPVPTGQDGEK